MAKQCDKEKLRRAQDAGFAQGVAYAAAYLEKTHGETSLAAFVLGDTGMNVEHFRKAKVPGYEMRVVSKLFRTDPYLSK
jgi:hypothetical protein